MTGFIGWNGDLVPSGQAAVSVMDHGFLYGMSLFEKLAEDEAEASPADCWGLSAP